MSAPYGPQEGAVGVNILFTVLDQTTGLPKDISSASRRDLIIKRPDGTEMIISNADWGTNGSDGQLRYVTLAPADLTPSGAYWIQAYLEIQTFKGRTAASMFEVYKNQA
jgi:hypothetical protein